MLAGCTIGAVGQCARGQAAGDARLALFGGPTFRTGATTRPFELGISGDVSLLQTGRGKLGVGALAEGGLYHPAVSGKGSFYFSADAMLERFQPRWATESAGMRAFAVAGYTRLFNATETAVDVGNAFNAGVGLDRVIRDDLWLRVELRGRYAAADGSHALVLRIGLAGSL